jgi:hypothetical protein
MKKLLTKKRISNSERLLDQLLAVESSLSKLPELSVLEKAQLDQHRAIESLYYSSKLEGSNLTQKRIDQAIYGKNLSAA